MDDNIKAVVKQIGYIKSQMDSELGFLDPNEEKVRFWATNVAIPTWSRAVKWSDTSEFQDELEAMLKDYAETYKEGRKREIVGRIVMAATLGIMGSSLFLVWFRRRR